MAQTLKFGTRIQLRGTPSMGGMPAVPAETATIARWIRSISGERMPGWHCIRFDSDRAMVLAHESNFTVVQ